MKQSLCVLLALGIFCALAASQIFAFESGLASRLAVERDLEKAGFLLPGNLLVQAPAPEKLSVEDLGFSTAPAGSDPDLDRIKARRKTMLNAHQILGLTTAAVMTATMATAEEEEEEHGSGGENHQAPNIHKNLGILSGVLYLTTASFAWFAPTPPGLEASGASLWHRRLAWIHGPALILAPILGNMANESYKKNEQPQGLARHHGAVVAVGYSAFMLSIVTLYVEF